MSDDGSRFPEQLLDSSAAVMYARSAHQQTLGIQYEHFEPQGSH